MTWRLVVCTLTVYKRWGFCEFRYNLLIYFMLLSVLTYIATTIYQEYCNLPTTETEFLELRYGNKSTEKCSLNRKLKIILIPFKWKQNWSGCVCLLLLGPQWNTRTFHIPYWNYINYGLESVLCKDKHCGIWVGVIMQMAFFNTVMESSETPLNTANIN